MKPGHPYVGGLPWKTQTPPAVNISGSKLVYGCFFGKFTSVFSVHRRSLGPCPEIVRLMPQMRCVVRALKLPLVLGPDSLTCQFWPKRLAAHGRNLSVCLLLAVFCVEASARHGFTVIACTPGVHALQRYALS